MTEKSTFQKVISCRFVFFPSSLQCDDATHGHWSAILNQYQVDQNADAAVHRFSEDSWMSENLTFTQMRLFRSQVGTVFVSFFSHLLVYIVYIFIQA